MEKQTIYRIAWDDYLKALEGSISSQTLGKVKDELGRKIPNLLKDEKKRVEYKQNDMNQHAHIMNPSHGITLTKIVEETI